MRSKRTYAPRLNLTREEEIAVAAWYSEHPEFWRKDSEEYKDRARKDYELNKLAGTLQTKCTGAQLATWLKSMRSRYGRLVKPDASGSAKTTLTSKEQWILEAFSCCRDYINRLPGRIQKVNIFYHTTIHFKPLKYVMF